MSFMGREPVQWVWGGAHASTVDVGESGHDPTVAESLPHTRTA